MYIPPLPFNRKNIPPFFDKVSPSHFRESAQDQMVSPRPASNQSAALLRWPTIFPPNKKEDGAPKGRKMEGVTRYDDFLDFCFGKDLYLCHRHNKTDRSLSATTFLIRIGIMSQTCLSRVILLNCFIFFLRIQWEKWSVLSTQISIYLLYTLGCIQSTRTGSRGAFSSHLLGKLRSSTENSFGAGQQWAHDFWHNI